MPANTTPIFSKVGHIEWKTVLTANTTTDLTSGTTYLLFTADATNGSRVERIRVIPLGTNVASVLRIWLNNGSTPATAANNTLLAEIALPATTVSQVTSQTPIDLPASSDLSFPLVLPLGYRLYATLGTVLAAGVSVAAIGGDY